MMTQIVTEDTIWGCNITDKITDRMYKYQAEFKNYTCKMQM